MNSWPGRSSGYIVPSAIIPGSIFADSQSIQAWHAYPIPADPSKSLLFIEWDNPNFEREFEERTDVEILPLGLPWEAIPAEAVPLIASFNPESQLAQTATLMATRLPEGTAVELPNVHRALRDALGMRTYR